MSDILSSIGKRESAAVALALAFLSLLFLRPSIRGNDGVGNYVYLMSLLRDGDFDFTNEYATFDLRDGDAFHLSATPRSDVTGLPANRYGIGCAVFWAPTVGLVHGILRLVDPSLAVGIGRPYEWAVAIGSAWWGCLGLWLLYLRLRRDFSTRSTALAIAGIVFASPLCFYLWLHGSMSHAIGFYVMVMALLSLERAWQAPRGIAPLLLGAWCGILILVRVQDVSWAAALGLAMVLVPIVQARRATPPPDSARPNPWLTAALASALYGVGALLALLPQFAVWKMLYGRWLSGPLPYMGREGGMFERLPVHILEALFTERGGALAWHPILLLAVIGLVVGRRKLGFPLLLAAALGLAFQLYLVSSWSMWWGGASFGNRFFISSYPVLVFGLAFWDSSWCDRNRRRLFPVILAALIVWNGGLLLQYGSGMISREKQEGWAKVVRNQFVEVPVWIVRRIR